MEASLDLFNSLCNSRRYSGAPLILVLMKVDLLAEKIARVPLERYFPEYNGGRNVNNALAFITQKFMSVRLSEETKPVFAVAADLVNQGGQRAFWSLYEKLVSGQPAFVFLAEPSHLFAVAVFLSDFYLKLNDEDNNPPLRRYLAILTKLPMDLQMVLSHLTARSPGTNIPSSDAEEGFRALSTFFSR